MENYPEVNWSEICRKAIVDYVETRSYMDIGPILERLKTEHNDAFKQGQIYFYQIAPKIPLSQFEKWYPLISTKILEGREPCWFGDSPPLSPEVAQVQAPRNMLGFLARLHDSVNEEIYLPAETPTSFLEGAIAAFMNIYEKLRPKKN